MDNDRSLTDQLAELGIRHTEGDNYLRRKLYRDEEYLGQFSASEGWELVKKIRQEARRD